MKKLLMIAVLVSFSQVAQADWLIKFKDKTANVWPSYYQKGSDYCTTKSFGEYCVRRSDVASIKEVPEGTEATEYGMSTLGSSEAEQRRQEASTITSQTAAEMAEKKRLRDVEIDQRAEQRKRDVEARGERAVLDEERRGNSVK